MMSRASCSVCNSSSTTVFFSASDMPVHVGLQWPGREEARDCPRGDMELLFCRDCGFITNLAFDPGRLEYAQAYDNSLHFSPFFQEYARSAASRLVEGYSLYDKDVIEIGCGKGDFLKLLCDLGGNRGVGFEPSRQNTNGKAGFPIIKDFYSEQYADYTADLVCCRFVFEHIPDPVGFLNTVRQSVENREGSVAFFEVPNVFFILRDLSIWDLIYEHCSYFSPKSLAYVFAACGFNVLDVRPTYGEQFLSIEAGPGRDGETGPEAWKDGGEAARYVADFGAAYRNKLREWRNILCRIEASEERAVVWGAGAKSVSFMNLLGVEEGVDYVVDRNPRKEGKYLAGTGQRIVSPEFLKEYRPDKIIVMNRIYKDEIQRQVQEFGLAPQFLYV